MTLTTQKRLAADILNVGKGKVIFDNLRLEDISKAITRADVRELIKDKAIMKKTWKKQSRKVKIASKGPGKIKIRVKNRKAKYVAKIRKLRRYLSEIRGKKTISTEEYQYLRKLAKSGHFKTRRHLKEYLTTILKKKMEDEKTNKSAVQKKTAK